MGEIKSTLEIIMEKTKGLTMSDEERAAYKEQEATRKIKGLVQKYAYRAIDLGSLRVELVPLEKEYPGRLKKMLLQETLPRIEMDEDNEPIFELLEKVLGLDTGPMRKALEEARQSLDMKRVSLEKAMLERLEEKGISGSAVLPNISADKAWARRVGEMMDALRRELETYAFN
ncbi:MAG: hypothetical protein JRH06_04290 [Deltaproteobacteria bacterium]|nr:hypothetical protein [Deltaproteobacteria bacterium]MBW2136759.1 hypothetical protein [Deltaproteobacteria bacterium]